MNSAETRERKRVCDEEKNGMIDEQVSILSFFFFPNTCVSPVII